MKNKVKTTATRTWRAIKPHLPATLFWSTWTLGWLWFTLVLYAAAHAYATAKRGYEAIGGEAFVWLLPLGAYALTAWVAHYARRRTPIDADYTILPQLTMKELEVGFAEISGVMVEIGVSAMEAAEAFQTAMTWFEARPLEIAFLGPNHRITQFGYREFIEDNDQPTSSLYRRRAPTTLRDGTRLTLLCPQVMDVVAKGRRFDQVIVASAPGGRFAAELAGPICELKARSTGRVPEEYFLQFYDLDSPRD